jgi:hypothetical protein
MIRNGCLVGVMVVFGCAGSTRATVQTIAVPENAVRGGWAEARVQEGVSTVLRTLAEGGVSGLQRLRLHHDEVQEIFTEAGVGRIERSVPGGTPSSRDRRWQTLGLHRNDAIVGWCARGVHVAESNGIEGFRERTLYVERLLIVGQEDGGRWATWVEGLMLTGNGWRMLPWVPYADAVEVPRRDHTDLTLWDCDLARRSW